MGKAGIRFLLVLWLVAIALQVRKSIAASTGWPKPSVLVKTTVAFSALGLLSEVSPDIAAALAVGLTLALLINDPTLLKTK